MPIIVTFIGLILFTSLSGISVSSLFHCLWVFNLHLSFSCNMWCSFHREHTILLSRRHLSNLYTNQKTLCWARKGLGTSLALQCCAGLLSSGFQSRIFSRDYYDERLFSLKENGTRYGRGHTAIPLFCVAMNNASKLPLKKKKTGCKQASVLCTSHLKPPPPPIRAYAGHSLFIQVKASEVSGPQDNSEWCFSPAPPPIRA